MFKRDWSSLPEDPAFASTLKGLGYFINDEDEIRSIENPDCYFDFFIDKNDRVNQRQRFAFNHALQKIVHSRIGKHGLVKMRLPLATGAGDRHTPFFATPGFGAKSRVVVVFGETCQDLGVVAGRVANGPGGINKGSMVSVIRKLLAQPSSDTDPSPPGIVLANVGQTYWSPEEGRAMTMYDSPGVKLPSLVHCGHSYTPSLNDIPGSESPRQHMATLFGDVLGQMDDNARLDVIAIGESCEMIEEFFDDRENWAAWKGRLNAMLHLGSVYPTTGITNAKFVNFLKKRTRGYIISSFPLDTPLAPPEGNTNEGIPPLGCPTFSSSELHFSEMILIRALDAATEYLQMVATTPEFENGPITVAIRPPPEETDGAQNGNDEAWDQVPTEQKPSVTVADTALMQDATKQLRRWNKFKETGEAPESDSDE